jgi:hypothetical protein
MNGAMRCTSFDGDGTSGLVRGRRARLGRVGFTDAAARQVGAWWFVVMVLHGGDGGAVASGELWWEAMTMAMLCSSRKRVGHLGAG